MRAEIDLYASSFSNTALTSIFLGGGTPSLLDPDHIDRLFQSLQKSFEWKPDIEVTLEANPESVTEDRVRSWLSAGINRISMGLQVYDDETLKKIDRIHTVQRFEEAYALLRTNGFKNINMDLIYGLPSQTLQTWQTTVTKTLSLNPEHLSFYALKVEPHTPFAAAGITVDDDRQAEMYEWAREYLTQKGYDLYEISNAAKSKKECRHNMIYWEQKNYLGLGVGAVGSVEGRRWENVKSLPEYFKRLEKSKKPIQSEEVLDDQTKKFERLMLGLRLRKGMQWREESNPVWKKAREDLLNQGQLEYLGDDQWRIANPFVAMTNQILLQFLP